MELPFNVPAIKTLTPTIGSLEYLSLMTPVNWQFSGASGRASLNRTICLFTSLNSNPVPLNNWIKTFLRLELLIDRVNFCYA